MAPTNAPPAARSDNGKSYRDHLIDLLDRPEWASMAEGTQNRALDVLKVAADIALKSIELAHAGALGRNALLARQLRQESAVASAGAGAGAETAVIRAETERLKAEVARTLAQKERWKAEVAMLEAKAAYNEFLCLHPGI